MYSARLPLLPLCRYIYWLLFAVQETFGGMMWWLGMYSRDANAVYCIDFHIRGYIITIVMMAVNAAVMNNYRYCCYC